MRDNQFIVPIMKWVGGKRQLLGEIIPLLPKGITNYCEPFLGGGAVLFSMQPQNAIINDINRDLMIVYKVVKEDVEGLIESLKKHENTSEYFYWIRGLDREISIYESMSNIEKASRILYLNKTCYNGLFRVNAKGQFNAPFGRYVNPNIVNESRLRAVSEYFKNNNIQIFNKDFEEVLEYIPKDCLVYLDPPYDPVSATASFTSYNSERFGKEEQIRLKQRCDILNQRGIKFMVSNSATDFIKDLWKDYIIVSVYAKRSINSNGSGRKPVEELLIRNYQ